MPSRPLVRALSALLLVAALSACKREPSFDERYAGAKTAIQKKAAELDKDMAKRAAETKGTSPTAGDAASTAAAGAT